jgi:hypothetical protein
MSFISMLGILTFLGQNVPFFEVNTETGKLILKRLFLTLQIIVNGLLIYPAMNCKKFARKLAHVRSS